MIKPLAGYVLIEPFEKDQEVTAGGLALPEKAKEKPAKGTIIEVGKDEYIYYMYPSGVPTPTSGERPLQVKKGEIVVFHRWSGQDVKDGEKEYKLVKFSDIMGIYE